jgi:hypothetical protein
MLIAILWPHSHLWVSSCPLFCHFNETSVPVFHGRSKRSLVQRLGRIGSGRPADMNMRLPDRLGIGSGKKGIIALNRIEPASTSGLGNSILTAMLSPLEYPIATVCSKLNL